MSDARDGAGRFPRVFHVAILLEVFERLAFYGAYVNLAVYLSDTVGLSDVENGVLLGWFAAARAWLPVATGALSDRIGFRRSLLASFALYIVAYGALVAFPFRVGAWCSVLGMAFAGAFLKPVIPAAVRRYSPKGRESLGFSAFYASVNAGSVIGKTGAKIVRTAVSLRMSLFNSVLASVLALVLTALLFFEPGDREGDTEVAGAAGDKAEKPGFLESLGAAAKNPRFVIFLLLVSGYYLLIEQFYQTFPVYIRRQLGEGAPREYITLINPAAIALLQIPMGWLTKRTPPILAMTVGILVGSASMLLMGSLPTLAGACGSFFVFAIAEMIYSPRYYEYVSSFAPKGREGLYMGLALMPFGLGGLVGGVLSGRLIARYLPKDGVLQPLHVWGTYAAIGVVCAVCLGAFGVVTAVASRRASSSVR